MGHLRLTELPTGRRWEQVAALLRIGAGPENLAAATAFAAEQDLASAKKDPAFHLVVWLLTQLPLAARSSDFSEQLGRLRFASGSATSVAAFVAEFLSAVDEGCAGSGERTDLGELASQAAAESLSLILIARTGSLFGTEASDLRENLAQLGTKPQFAGLARDFFARLTQRILDYYISRALPDHVGPGRANATIADQVAFRNALARHCHEAALIVEEFAGSWYSKSIYLGTLTPESTRRFASHALDKMRDELRARRAFDD